MKKQTAIKILAAMLTILMLTVCMQSTVFGIGPGDIQPNVNTSAANTAKTASGKILGIVQVIAVAVAVIMLVVLAIKYISSAPNDKAEIKKHAVIYVVGAVLLFGASAILELIKTFSEDAFKATVG